MMNSIVMLNFYYKCQQKVSIVCEVVLDNVLTFYLEYQKHEK